MGAIGGSTKVSQKAAIAGTKHMSNSIYCDFHGEVGKPGLALDNLNNFSRLWSTGYP